MKFKKQQENHDQAKPTALRQRKSSKSRSLYEEKVSAKPGESCSLNKYVFSDLLNMVTELELLMECGMHFHILGPATGKSLFPDFQARVPAQGVHIGGL